VPISNIAKLIYCCIFDTVTASILVDDQLEATEPALKTQLRPYSVKYRIVTSKCRTQEINNTEFKKFLRRCGKALQYQTNQLEEYINIFGEKEI